MVEVKVERRSSGRLVNKRIILSEDEGNEAENVIDNSNRSNNIRNKKGGFIEDEEFIPPSRRREVPVSEDSEDSEESESSDSEYRKKRRRRERVEELRERRSLRTSGRLRESEKLIDGLTEMESGTRRRSERNKMEEEDAALAAAISAGYFSDDEREMEHVRLRNGTRFKDHSNQPSSTNTTPTYNPYARNGLGAFTGPMRRSGRTAAVVGAARVAMYSSLLNPDSSVHVEEPPAPKYNLRPNRPGGANDDHAAAAAAMYYEYTQDGTTMSSSSRIERLFEEDDVDGNHETIGNESGEVSLAALDKIAGMDGYVRKLKEMIVFPLIYPHLFSKLNISLPRGVLFHGPPGTGKTLMARLLASACSTSTRKVSFFMRNGSDCLSKWIGEAERNMRLLFKKAKECQPSIIFFDEIDGLAPERTGRQDQSHISLVSTLLALMDGLDDRGQVVVIGATNRIHSIDAALRRPGRFDREFFFGLPDEPARAQILKIHTSTWDPPIEDTLAVDLANRTSGYSGADMKALCVEAALRAVQRTFPEVYENTKPLKSAEEMPVESVRVEAADFEFALTHLNPSNRRHVSQYDLISLQKPQSLLYDRQSSDLRTGLINPILKRNLMVDASGKMTWQTLEPLIIKIVYDSKIHPESFVWRFVCGIGDGLDGFTVHPVDLKVLSEEATGLSAALWKGLNDARVKGGAFCVLFKGFSTLNREEKKIFKSNVIRFMKTLMPGEPVVLLFTSNRLPKSDVVGMIKSFELKSPDESQRSSYSNFVLRSLYRLMSSERRILVTEDEFINSLFRTGNLNTPVIEIEKWRMCIGDEGRSDPLTFSMKYFNRIIYEEIKVSSNEREIEKEQENETEKEQEDENGKDTGHVIDNESDENQLEGRVQQQQDSSDEIESPENLLFK